MQTVPTTVHQERDWEFFYKSLDGPVTERCMDSLTEPLPAPTPASPPAQREAMPPRANPLSKLRTQSASYYPLGPHPSDPDRRAQACPQATHGQRYRRHRRPGHDHARERSHQQDAHRAQPPRCATRYNSQVRQRRDRDDRETSRHRTKRGSSIINKMPTAHNHRDAPPGTTVKYGNGEIETIERLVDIGQNEVQDTPDICQASLISVDQIVQDGHTVTFSATETIIADDKHRYSLSYPRVPDSREWTVSMHAMEEITKLRQSNPRNIQRN